MRRLFCYLSFAICAYNSAWSATCPSGYSAYRGTDSGLIRDMNGKCLPACNSGIQEMLTSTGRRFDVFANRNTTPSINIKVGNTTCYVDLISGQSDTALNLTVNGSTYHTNPTVSQACVVNHTLSYNCGDGSGVPPSSHEIVYGDLYTAPYNPGTCRKAGHSLSGWAIDSTSLTVGQYYNYTYDTDKIMVAQWTPNTYVAAYVCNNDTVNSSYLSGTYGSSVTPATDVCTPEDGATFSGWRILDLWGNKTGETVSSGGSFTWTYPYNIRLQAIWK